jgi:hypothetical protein
MQLKMGGGKTRVILPCLVLEWTRRRPGESLPPIPRIVALSPLLADCYAR